MAGWCLHPLVTYERVFRNRVHVTRCTRRAVTLLRLEELPPGTARSTAPRQLQHGQGRELLSPPQSQHSRLGSTVQSVAQLQHTSYTPDS